MIETLVRLLLRLVARVTAEQWEAAVRAVIDTASRPLPPGITRKDVWKTLMKGVADNLPSYLANYLRESAVAYAVKKGLIAPP